MSTTQAIRQQRISDFQCRPLARRHAPVHTEGDTRAAAGFIVMIGADSDGNSIVEAANEKTGERFVVWAQYLYAAVVELAGQVGIELEDG